MAEAGITACGKCQHTESTLHYDEGVWVCRSCYVRPPLSDTCRLFEMGHENPIDKGGSTAHVRDIKDRRWHPTEKRQFYYSKELGKRYFFSKG